MSMKMMSAAILSAISFGSPALAQSSASIPVPVNCLLGQTINSVIETSLLSAVLEIQLLSSCNENIVINRDDVTIQGIPGTRTITIVGGINATAANRLVFKDMTIRDGGDIGVRANKNASLLLDNVEVTGHPVAAVAALQQSHISVRDSRLVSGANAFATFYADQSGMEAANTEFISMADKANTGAAIGLYRLSNVRVTDGSVIRNTNSSSQAHRALAVYSIDGSSFAAFGSGVTIDGNVTFRNNAISQWSNVSMTGNLLADNGSLAMIRNGTVINGTAKSFLLSRLMFSSSAGAVSGNVVCAREGRVVDDTNSLSLSGCAPL